MRQPRAYEDGFQASSARSDQRVGVSEISFWALFYPSYGLRTDRWRWRFLLETFFPLLPLFNEPLFFLCIARSTSLDADLEYLRGIWLPQLNSHRGTKSDVGSRIPQVILN
jgi:hypothetical protein